jgi:hypothetical protein
VNTKPAATVLAVSGRQIVGEQGGKIILRCEQDICVCEAKDDLIARVSFKDHRIILRLIAPQMIE